MKTLSSTIDKANRGSHMDWDVELLGNYLGDIKVKVQLNLLKTFSNLLYFFSYLLWSSTFLPNRLLVKGLPFLIINLAIIGQKIMQHLVTTFFFATSRDKKITNLGTKTSQKWLQITPKGSKLQMDMAMVQHCPKWSQIVPNGPRT